MPVIPIIIATAGAAATAAAGAGLLVAVGVFIEQKVSEFLVAIPVIGQFSEILTPVLIGSLAGLATTLTVYLIDKIDLFGVIAKEKHQFTMNTLEASLEKLFTKADELIADTNKSTNLLLAET